MTSLIHTLTNSCLHAGDIRLVDLVELPELMEAELLNVLVFPQA